MVIVSSNAVPDAALTAAYRTILQLTGKRPDVLQAMLPHFPRISIMGLSETASDLPDIEDEIWEAYVAAVRRGDFAKPRDEPLEGITPFDAYGDDEYLTHNVNAWFNLDESLPGPWVDVQIGDSGPPSGTKAELRARDPQLHEIISRFMPESLGDLMAGCGGAARPYDPSSSRPYDPSSRLR